jgi:hypothetical protein
MVSRSMKAVLVAGVSVLCGCAGLGQRTEQQPPVEVLDEHGVSAPTLLVEAGTVIQFINGDARPHQIYSNDCSELSSTVLSPGETYAVGIGLGPKLCHFQDLLSPVSRSYSGTVQVHDEQEERRRETAD